MLKYVLFFLLICSVAEAQNLQVKTKADHPYRHTGGDFNPNVIQGSVTGITKLYFDPNSYLYFDGTTLSLYINGSLEQTWVASISATAVKDDDGNVVKDDDGNIVDI